MWFKETKSGSSGSRIQSESSEVYASAILGWRIFEIDWKTYTLVSPHQKEIWEPGLTKAKCKAEIPCRTLPGEYCDCGLYAYHDFWFQRTISTGYSLGQLGQIGAAVAGKGNAFIHNEGFRCQEMQILCFYSDKREAEKKRVLESKFSVPVFEDANKFKNFAEGLADPLDTSYIPGNPQLSLF